MSNVILASISANSATSLSRCTSFLYIALSTYSSEESLFIRLVMKYSMLSIFSHWSVLNLSNSRSCAISWSIYFIHISCSIYSLLSHSFWIESSSLRTNDKASSKLKRFKCSSIADFINSMGRFIQLKFCLSVTVPSSDDATSSFGLSSPRVSASYAEERSSALLALSARSAISLYSCPSL